MDPHFTLFAAIGSFDDMVKTLLSAGSFLVTVYFWFVRINRERQALRIHAVDGFEGALEPGHVGIWSGRIFIVNASIVPTAVVFGRASLLWKGTWIDGRFHSGENGELPWNLPPTQAFAKNIALAFQLPDGTTTDAVYCDQRIRVTLIGVDGKRSNHEFQTAAVASKV